MKKIIGILFIFLGVFLLTGCKSDLSKTSKLEIDEHGHLVISEEDLSSNVTFYEYEIDGTTIEIIALKNKDNSVRLAFNTCQACNPAEHAYFLQDGKYLVCQNCGTKISLDDVGIKSNGCNPFPILDENRETEGNKIIFTKEFVESYKSKFVNIKKEGKFF